jgi:hypothetical protein
VTENVFGMKHVGEETALDLVLHTPVEQMLSAKMCITKPFVIAKRVLQVSLNVHIDKKVCINFFSIVNQVNPQEIVLHSHKI